MTARTKASLLRRSVVAAAGAYVAFFVWIVVIADRANGTPWWSFIELIPWGDKVGHLGLIGTLSVLCNLAFPSRKFGPATAVSLILLALLSAEELSQAFIPTRHLDLFDWLADLAGLAVGQLAAMKARQCLTVRRLKSLATKAP